MKQILLLLIFCASLPATAGLGKDLSNMFCSQKLRKKAETALFPTDGSPSFFVRNKRDPNRWYSMDKEWMKDVCFASRLKFHNLDFRGIKRQWYCGHKVTACWFEDRDRGGDNDKYNRKHPDRPSGDDGTSGDGRGDDGSGDDGTSGDGRGDDDSGDDGTSGDGRGDDDSGDDGTSGDGTSGDGRGDDDSGDDGTSGDGRGDDDSGDDGTSGDDAPGDPDQGGDGSSDDGGIPSDPDN